MKKVKKVAATYKKQQTPTLYDESNQPIFSKEKVTKNTWEQYIENLFSDERPPLLVEGPLFILLAEIVRAISSAQNKKSPGPDEIPIEPETSY